jgi:hypothetical protein
MVIERRGRREREGKKMEEESVPQKKKTHQTLGFSSKVYPVH